MEDETSRRFYAVRLEDENPLPGNGSLIPYLKPKSSKPTQSKTAVLRRLDTYAVLALVPLAALVFVFSAGYVGIQSLASLSSAPVPEVRLPKAIANNNPFLNYGVQVALSQPNFFAETREAFVEAGTTFIEADLTNMRLRFFERGVLTESVPILAKGIEGTWWQTPAGLYSVEFKKERYFSTVGQVYQPWSLSFQGNFFIHGWPEFAKKTMVNDEFAGGGIRLADSDAERLYQLVTVGTPVLVHAVDVEAEAFVYEPKIPDLKTPHYLIADVKSNTVLASSNLDAVAPIASVAKLMTALIAAEYINLDSTVHVNEPTFVQSLIPRLGERSKVSMYSLLQLLLVESSNEAAEVIATQLGRDKFIELMNQKARSLGMLQTNFADASGLSSENTSSLSDLFRLSQYIYTNRSFILELTANQNTASSYIGGEFGELVNFNKVETLDNFIGGKVGETIAAGQTSVTLHTISVKGKERVVAIIILGSKSRNDDVRELLRYAEERFGS